MDTLTLVPLELTIEVERWPRITPLKITGYTFAAVEVVVVELRTGGATGRGEAAGVYYRGETASSIAAEIEALRPTIEAGITREALQNLLGPGGARNALDCALWDLEAKLSGRPVWQIAGLDEPRALRTTFTCGADAPADVAVKARSFPEARAIKLKLAGDVLDAQRVSAVRQVCPDVWLLVDANQGFTREKLDALMPTLIDAHVSLIEQPFPLDRDDLLHGLNSPIPIAADESLQTFRDVARVADVVDVVNIKLDKCGGLTEALAIARAAREAGLDVMVGSMGGTSLAMAPACIVGQLCEVIDLDGPALLQRDRPGGVIYSDGQIQGLPDLWGMP